jgi:hypothetical protein
LQSTYCRKRGITRDTVAQVVKMTLAGAPNMPLHLTAKSGRR